MSETAHIEKTAIYEAHDALEHLDTFIKLYRQALIRTPDLDEQKTELPEPEVIAELLAFLSDNAVNRMEIVFSAT